jgi:hypothetical protein
MVEQSSSQEPDFVKPERNPKYKFELKGEWDANCQMAE